MVMDLKELDKKACWCEEKRDSSLELNISENHEENGKVYRNLNEAITGYIDTEIGSIPKIRTKLNYKDALGCIGIRLGINKKNYCIKPGIYAVRKPTKVSPVLVTANYKFTFDKLRKELDVTKATGFRIIYGPIRAEDLKEFIINRFKASEKMRKVTLTFKERLVRTPLETI